MAKIAGRGSDQFMVRLPDGMRERIKAAAEANGRSMNAEIVATLERAYPAQEAAPSLEQAIKDVLVKMDSFRETLREIAEKKVGAPTPSELDP